MKGRFPQFRSGNKYSALSVILSINVVVFILEILFRNLFSSSLLLDSLSLSVEGVKGFHLWEFFSYSILHSSFMHIFFNMLALYFVGKYVESVIERRNFYILYFMGVLVGAIFWVLSNVFITHTQGILMGASAGVLAVLTCFCLIAPDRQIKFLIFFIIPVNMKPRTMLYILLGVEVFSYLSFELYNSSNMYSIANSAHLGGMFAGFLFTWLFRTDTFKSINISILKPKSRRMSADDLKYKVNILDIGELKRETNRILEKVSKEGFNSLSDKEKNILKQAKDNL